MVISDEHARFMWIRICRSAPLSWDIVFVVCYFTLAYLQFAFHHDSDGDLFLDLYLDISH